MINWDNAPEGFDLWIEDIMGECDPGFHRDTGSTYIDPQGFYWMHISAYRLKITKRPDNYGADAISSRIKQENLDRLCDLIIEQDELALEVLREGGYISLVQQDRMGELDKEIVGLARSLRQE